MDQHLANMVSAVQQVSNSPVVQLPTFNGKIIMYASFKKSFQFLIKQVAGPKSLWATHLANSLKGDAKKYIGDTTAWFDKYDQLWNALETKYANRWTLATETIKALFQKAPPPLYEYG